MRIIALVILVVLAGCGGGTDSEGDKKETVFDPLVQNIDKAKQVEDTVMQQKAAMDQAIRDAENGVESTEEESDD